MNTTFINPNYIGPIGFTTEAKIVRKNIANVKNVYIGTSILNLIKYESLEYQYFLELKNIWKEETEFISSGTLITSNISYQQIINMGRKTVPWIIEDLSESKDLWFYALSKITGENPVKGENIGNVEKMTEDWIEWATTNDHV